MPTQFDPNQRDNLLRQGATLEALHKKLAYHVVSPQELKEWLATLEKIDIDHLPSHFKNIYISLYGKIATLELNNQVDSLVEATFNLDQQGGGAEHEQEISRLTNRITQFLKEHALSTENRIYIRMALLRLDRLSTRKTPRASQAPTVLARDATLLKEDHQAGKISTLIVILYESAALLHHGQVAEGIDQLKEECSPEEYDALRTFCQQHGGAPFLDDRHHQGHDLNLYRQQLQQLISSLLSYAHALYQNDPITDLLSNEQIEEILGRFDHHRG